MKKFVIFLAIVILMVCGISYTYLMYRVNSQETKRQNQAFESYENQVITGTELSSVINRAMDSNSKNQIEKQKDGTYLSNTTNSIKVEVKMLDNGKTYSMESLVSQGLDEFIQYYYNVSFKCTRIDYHETTKKVSYLLFEQMTTTF